MSRIAIISQSIGPGDAVGNDILESRRVLTELGHQVELFSSHWIVKSPYSSDIRELDDYLDDDPSAILILHHAIGWQMGVDALARATCRRVVRYHNVTPARFFAGLPGESFKGCLFGREQLRRLVRLNCDLYLSASAYNQEEFLALGADPSRCAVAPPFHHIDRLARLRPDPVLLSNCRDGQTNLLFVGRCSPNKGHRFLIDAFAAYWEHHDRNSRLILVGRQDPTLAPYTNGLRDQAMRLGVQDRVLFVNGASEEELRAYYESAHVFVVASEHEGFCVPVVEAMALGVPVVAYGTCAVPDTVGAAGIVWDDFDPFLLAEACAAAAHDARIRSLLIERGRQRFLDHFSNAAIERDFLRAVGNLCAA
jgi:glycosyltransferase involved in cell wall biosynthesis